MTDDHTREELKPRYYIKQEYFSGANADMWCVKDRTLDGQKAYLHLTVAEDVAQAFCDSYALKEENTRLRDVLSKHDRAHRNFINQYGDPFEPKEQWEEYVSAAVKRLYESWEKVRAALKGEK